MSDNNLPLISVVIPCYNEEEVLLLFMERISMLSSDMKNVEFEIVFVDDGSRDKTLLILRELASRYVNVRYISFSRNFGKEAAMLAGLESAKGDYIAVIDADLQDPPELLREMYESIVNDGYDCVASRRVTRKGESAVRSIFAKMFYKIINKISETEVVDGARDFRLMTRQVVESIISLKEYNRFSKGLFSWVGFNTKWLEYVNVERAAGKTKWSFWKLFSYAIDGIIDFSAAPLAISSFFGMLFFLFSLIGVGFITVRRIAFGDPVAGWASTICIILFIGGIQLFCTGVLGQYIAKTYMEIKNRPIYIVKEKN